MGGKAKGPKRSPKVAKSPTMARKKASKVKSAEKPEQNPNTVKKGLPLARPEVCVLCFQEEGMRSIDLSDKRYVKHGCSKHKYSLCIVCLDKDHTFELLPEGLHFCMKHLEFIEKMNPGDLKKLEGSKNKIVIKGIHSRANTKYHRIMDAQEAGSLVRKFRFFRALQSTFRDEAVKAQKEFAGDVENERAYAAIANAFGETGELVQDLTLELEADYREKLMVVAGRCPVCSRKAMPGNKYCSKEHKRDHDSIKNNRRI